MKFLLNLFLVGILSISCEGGILGDYPTFCWEDFRRSKPILVASIRQRKFNFLVLYALWLILEAIGLL